MEVTMADERIVDQPKPISDQALDSVDGGTVFSDALAKAKELAQILSNIEKSRNDMAAQTVQM
jgi:hypothetical protein